MANDLIPIPPNTSTELAATGNWVVICGVCTKRIRANTARKRWDGLIVCAEDWEPRHSLDFIRSKAPRVTTVYAPSEPAYQFTEVSCPFPAQFAMADRGTADCAKADNITKISL